MKKHSKKEVPDSSEGEKLSKRSENDKTEIGESGKVKNVPTEVVEKKARETPVGMVLSIAKLAAEVLTRSGSLISIEDVIPGRRAERKKSLEEQKTALVKELINSGIDPLVFDALLSNEIDRRLKIRFGIAFLLLTFLFTAASYSIVIFDGIYDWKISEVAITALIIETPIQFIGLLYIIARNLFPQSEKSGTLSKK